MCGNGGYYNLHTLNAAVGAVDPATGAKLVYGQDTNWGYMTLTVSAQSISGVTTTVANVGQTTPPAKDSFSYPSTAIVLPEGAMVSL